MKTKQNKWKHYSDSWIFPVVNIGNVCLQMRATGE